MKKITSAVVASVLLGGGCSAAHATEITDMTPKEIMATYAIGSTYTITIPAEIQFLNFNSSITSEVSASNILLNSGENLRVLMRPENAKLINGASSYIEYKVAIGDATATLAEVRNYAILNIPAGTLSDSEDLSLEVLDNSHVELAGHHADRLTFTASVAQPLMTNANITSEQNLTLMDIQNSTVSGGTIEESTIDGTMLYGGTVSNSLLISSTLNAGTIAGSTLKNSAVYGGTISSSTIESTTLNAGTVRKSTLKDSTINGGTINESNLYAATVNNGTLDGCSFIDATITGGKISNAEYDRTNLIRGGSFDKNPASNGAAIDAGYEVAASTDSETKDKYPYVVRARQISPDPYSPEPDPEPDPPKPYPT